jgi:hypothetical protein
MNNGDCQVLDTASIWSSKGFVSLYRGLFCARNADSSDFAIVLVELVYDDYVLLNKWLYVSYGFNLLLMVVVNTCTIC